MTRQALGKWGENIAANYLLDKGYEILGRNVRTSYGELDLVTRFGDVLVFVEVKTRRTTEFGLPEQSITQQKRSHILQAAQSYLLANELSEIDWRIDVIAINMARGQSTVITQFENAIY
ncbi:MAG TPA: YraN family protein [Anaerolineales bacterium]|nr:YraN family protein [Anaerolineales bacterium]